MKSSSRILRHAPSGHLFLVLAVILLVVFGWVSNIRALQSPLTLIVDSIADTGDADTGDGICDDGQGVCTLRAAIEQANASSGADTITFNIPGTGPHTIQPASALPTITDPLTIDGTTQSGFTGSTPMIELNGYAAGSGADGLKIKAGNSTIRGLVINGFSDAGIELRDAGGNTLSSNFIGTTVSGSGYAGNKYGILIVNSSGNMIGGTSPGSGNLISGNQNDGLKMQSGASDNVVQGNYVGTDLAGTAALGNGDEGVQIDNGTGNQIGGTAVNAGNVIAGNVDDGISLAAGAENTLIQGNLVGLDATGTAAIGNGGDGIQAYDAVANQIGGTTAGSRNVVAGNGRNGIIISASTLVTNNVVLGNYVGTDASGSLGLGNGDDGIELYRTSNHEVRHNLVAGSADDGIQAGDSQNVLIAGNRVGTDANGILTLGNGDDGILLYDTIYATIGGATVADRNLVAGSGGDGIDISGNTPVTGTVVQGNYIGTNQDGTAVLGNGDDGIDLWRATDHTIRDNLVAGSGGNGMEIGETSDSLIAGNRIGVDAGGTYTLGNGIDGISLWEGSFNTIGGTTTADRNLVAGSGDDGIQISSNSGVPGNVVQGNYVGTNHDGTAVLGNGDDGIDLWHVTDHTIRDNLVAGSGDNGIQLGETSRSLIAGNLVGVDAGGTYTLGNGIDGISLWEGSFNTIGGATAADRNLVAGSGDDGIDIGGSTIITGNVVQGNYVGTNHDGTAVLGNGDDGIDLWRVTDHTIRDNLVAGSGDNGIQLGETSHSLIAGNLVGVDAGGTYTLGNGHDGITLWESAFNTIGGASATDRNLVAGSADDGIEISSDSGVPGNVISGNYIGTNHDGTAVLGNGSDGIDLWRVTDLTISGNLVAGNGDDGIDAGDSSQLLITGNQIGTNASGTAVLGNGDDGIMLWETGLTTIGGNTPQTRNLISGNGNDGIDISSNTIVTGNVILGNYIGSDESGTILLGNGDDGIDLWRVGDHLVGGTNAGAGNLIVGSGNDGVVIGESTNIVLQGNLLGTDAQQTAVLGNGDEGIQLYATSNSTVGGTAAGAANVIANSGDVGVYIYNDASTGNAIRANQIRQNGGLGIDLAPYGATGNDTGDVDTGPNNRQNFPVLTAASGSAAATAVGGTLQSAANTDFTLDFFANPGCDSSGYGEGEFYLGTTTATTDGSGTASFSATLPTGSHGYAFITATATDPNGNTSEFSLCFPIEQAAGWEPVTTTTAPPVIGEYAITYDSTRDQVILYGGNATGWPYENGTWEFDGTDWTAVSTTNAPTAVYGAAMAYDSQRQLTILFGGSDTDDHALAETWTYDGTTWTRLTPANSPPPRTNHTLLYDPGNNNLLLFGGNDGPTVYNDLWLFDGIDWQPLAISGPQPAARTLHAMTYDAAAQEFVLFGGRDGSGTALDDLWTFAPTGGTWTAVTTGTAPPGRLGHSLVYLPPADQLLLVGGLPDGADAGGDDNWLYESGTGWQQITPAQTPPPGAFHTAVYRDSDASIILFIQGQTWRYQ